MMALRLGHHRLIEMAVKISGWILPPQCGSQIEIIAGTKAGIYAPGARHPDTVTPGAKIIGQRRNHTKSPFCLLNIKISRGAARVMICLLYTSDAADE